MSFTYDLTTNRGKVRLGLADTTAHKALFTDAEIDHFLTVGGSVDGAINEGLRVLIAGHAMKGDTERATALGRALAIRAGDLPTVDVDFPSLLPMDTDYDEA